MMCSEVSPPDSRVFICSPIPPPGANPTVNTLSRDRGHGIGG